MIDDSEFSLDSSKQAGEEDLDRSDKDEDMIGGLFAVRSSETELEKMNKSLLHQRDCSREGIQTSYPSEDDSQMLFESIRDRFVSRNWRDANKTFDDGDDYEDSGT